VSRRSRFLILAVLVILVALVVPALQRFVAQAEEGGQTPTPVAVEASHFAVSPPISELPPEDEVKVDDIEDKEVKSRPPKQFRPAAIDAGPGSIDGALQPPLPNRLEGAAPQEAAIPGPIVSFEGVSQADNFALFGGGVLPPDTDGDVGPNHYVLIVNNVYRIYDKTGTPLIPARKVSSIFSALGNACSTRDDGDPIVLYDPLADRWLISQFCVLANPNNHQLIAISRTGDPTGSYFLYDFMMPNNKFNDYPKFGVWPDGYYMTDNQFNQAGTAFLGGGVFAFDRAKMLAGDPTASFIYFDLFGLDPGIGGMLPSDMDGLNPPPAGEPNYFVYYTADEFGDPSDALRIFEFHADFTTPALSTFTERPESPLLVPTFDPRNPSGRNDIEQPAPGVNLDSIQDRLLFRLAYRNFGGQEGLVVNQTVNVGAAPTTSAGHQAAIRYYQLRRALPGGSFTLLDRATFAPDTDNRWMGSAAEDNQGNLAVGYSVSSTATFPSIRYAGRLVTDPPNGLFQGENSIVAGTGVQRHSTGRWGDYSDMSVDPADDCTFWYTQEYYTAASQALSTASWLTRVGSFKFAECTPAAKGAIQGTAYNSLTSLPIPGVLVQADGGYSRVTGAGGTYSMDTVPGAYNMTASFPGYLSDSASGVVVVDGATTTQDFFLTPIPIIQSAGASNVTGESCSPSTGGLDPGETVTLDLAVLNTGAADTLDLVGTLLPGGGVTSPSGPQSYGVVLAGGAAVARSFTFTVDSSLGCGSIVTASLHLQDGPDDLGTVTYTFTLGTLSNGTFPGSYSTGDIAVAIPDVSSVEIPIVVTDTGTVADTNVKIRLNHTFDGDLEIALIHPDGTSIIISDNRGGAGDNFGTGANDCSGTHTVFDDQAAVAISAGTAPFAGSFRPDNPLSAFNGKPTAGTWKLKIADTGASDVGTVGCVQLEIARRVQLCCPFAGGSPAMQAAPPATVVAEGCSPADGAVDPNETVSVSFPLQNFGTGATTNLVATLLPGGGVTSPGPDQTYGAVNPIGPPVARTFTFVAQGTCGGSIQATLHLQDGPDDLGNVTFTMSLGNFVPSFTENFDGVTAPALPAGWTATVTGASPPPAWATTTAAGFFVSPPNGAATGSSATLSESRLESDLIAVPPGLSARLSFRNNYNLESGFDGGVLEISIGGGAFQDILAAGGSFVAGGYNGTISTGFSSGIAGRQAWTGTSSGFILTTVNLPGTALGQNIRLRWRAAFDTSISVSGGGWRIDDVAVSTFQCCGPVVLAAPPATVTSESCGPANSAPDPDETVSVSFPLRNSGTASTSDLVATLLSGGGVNSPSGPESYGILVPGGAPVARSFSFVPSGICGGNITATLQLQDGTTDLGNVTFTIQLGTVSSVTTSFTNTGSITIPSVGTATPYPSSIAVSGLSGPVSKVTVTLFGINHTFPDDIDFLLVGPGGDKFIIMSDAGGGVDLVNTTITLDDAAATALPDGTLISSGTFRPSNYGTGDTFAVPAPPAPYQSPATAGTATFASVYNGKNPNGTWSLYVVDDASGDLGNVSGGWQITLTTSAPVCCSEACTLTCPSDIVASNDPGLCGAVVGYPAFGVSGSCGVVAGNPPSGSFFPVGDTTVVGTGTSTSDGVVGSCSFMVTVNDTEAPVLTVSLDPNLLWPPNHRLVDTTATVTALDNCGSATVVLDGITSSELDNAPGNGDGNTDDDIQDATYGTADFSFSLRAERSAGGQGRVYTATYSATDSSGNSSSASGTSFVPHDQDGTDDPLSLALSDSAFGTVLSWNQVSGAQHYSVIRGQLSGIHEQVTFIDLGAVSCMAVGTHAINTIGQEDTEVPAVGEVFFYAVAYHLNGDSSSYGAASAAKPRVTTAGGCE
jgi:subtilisin-like proprotein convertase family protein